MKKNHYSLIFGIAAVFSFAMILFYEFYYSPTLFHSDCATRLLIATEQIRTHELFPEGWYNTTGIFVGISELILIPFLLFCKNWIISRELGIVVELIGLFLVLYWFSRCIDKEKKFFLFFLSAIMFCLPFNHYGEMIYEAGYVSITVYLFLLCVCFFNLFEYREKNRKLYYVLSGITIFLSGYWGIRNYVVMFLPAILCIFIYYIIEFKENWLIKLKENHVWKFMIIYMIFILLTYLVFYYLQRKYSLVQSEMFTFVNDFENGLRLFIQIVFSFYNVGGSCALISLEGITVCANFVICLFSAFIAPCHLLFSYKNISNKYIKLFTLYAWISNFVVFFIMSLTTANAQRYYFSIFFNNQIMLVLYIYCFWERWSKEIKLSVTAIVFIFCIMKHMTYIKVSIDGINEFYEKEKIEGTLVDFLSENELNMGVASYWNAYNNMCKSNGNILIGGCIWAEHDEMSIVAPYIRFEWGTSEYYFDTSNYEGKFFLLLADGEYVDDAFYLQALDIKRFDRYTILIYENAEAFYNINFENNGSDYYIKSNDLSKRIDFSTLYYENNVVALKDKIIYKKGSYSFGPYISLMKGSYKIAIKGKKLGDMTIEGGYNSGKMRVPFELDKTETEDSVLEYNFQLQEDVGDMEFYIRADTSDLVITEIELFLNN